MGSEETTTDELKALLKELVRQFEAPESEAERERCERELAGLAERVSKPLPVDLCRFVLDTDKEDPRLTSLLLGFDALPLERILWNYRNRRDPMGFFEPYRLKDSYRVAPGRHIVVEFSLERMYEGPEVQIADVGSLIPVCQFQSEFIAYHLSEQAELNGLMVISYRHLGVLLAPSFKHHFADLLEGFEEQTYKVDEFGEPVFPGSWYHRQGVRDGVFRMDRFGEVK